MYSPYKDYSNVNHMIIGYSHSAMLYQFCEFLVFNLIADSSSFQGKTGLQPGGLSPPRDNQLIICVYSVLICSHS